MKPIDDDSFITGRLVSVEQDEWKSQADDAYLNVNARFIDVREEMWKIRHVKMACRHFKHPHTKENAGKLILAICAEFGISDTQLFMSTQDTASASLGALYNVERVGQLRCCGHVPQLMMKEAIRNCPELHEGN